MPYSSERGKGVIMGKLTVTPERIFILCRAMLKSDQPLSAIELAIALGIGDSHIWHICNVMEGDGLIFRRNVAEHGLRKKSRFYLTDNGRAVASGVFIEPTGKAREFSIRDLCNDVAYRQWLQGMKAIARGITT